MNNSHLVALLCASLCMPAFATTASTTQKPAAQIPTKDAVKAQRSKIAATLAAHKAYITDLEAAQKDAKEFVSKLESADKALQGFEKAHLSKAAQEEAAKVMAQKEQERTDVEKLVEDGKKQLAKKNDELAKLKQADKTATDAVENAEAQIALNSIEKAKQRNSGMVSNWHANKTEALLTADIEARKQAQAAQPTPVAPAVPQSALDTAIAQSGSR